MIRIQERNNEEEEKKIIVIFLIFICFIFLNIVLTF